MGGVGGQWLKVCQGQYCKKYLHKASKTGKELERNRTEEPKARRKIEKRFGKQAMAMALTMARISTGMALRMLMPLLMKMKMEMEMKMTAWAVAAKQAEERWPPRL